MSVAASAHLRCAAGVLAVVLSAGCASPRLRDPLDGYVPPRLDGYTDRPFEDREACWSALFDDTNRCIDACLQDSLCIADCWTRHDDGALRCRRQPRGRTS